MKTALKKIASLTMILLSFTFILSGCTLFEKNLSAYYNTVVISIEYPNGDVVDINKKELITAYNNYGASLVSNSGYTINDALDKTITALINQKVLIKDSEEKITFTNADKNGLWDDCISAMETNIDTFADDVKTDWGLTNPTNSDDESSSDDDSSKYVYTPFEPTATLEIVDGQYVIKVVSDDDTDKNEELKYSDLQDLSNEDLIINDIYNYIMQKTEFSSTNETLTDEEKIERQKARVYAEAINRYIKQLQTNEEGMRLSTDDISVFKREIKRIFDLNLDSLKVKKMEKKIDGDKTFSTITVQDVLNKYKEMLLETIQKYTISPDSFDDDVLSSFSDINYSENTNYFFVSHILMKYNDEQQTEYDSLTTKLNQGLISASYYKNRLQEIANNVSAVERDSEGNIITSSNKKAQTVLNEVSSALNNAHTDTQKAEVFRNYLYKYNEDTSALNADYLYVVGTENSQMVESFTEASRQLYDSGNGTFGSISGLVPSKYGVHIVFYAGPITNEFPIKINSVDNIVLTTDNIGVLNNTLLNPLNNKTLFDKVYSNLTESTSTANEQMYINNLKKDLKITKFKSRYDDLLG